MLRRLARKRWGENPYATRTWIRGHLSWWMIRFGFAGKGKDCAAAGGKHSWYNQDGESSHCYHFEVEEEGRLWESCKVDS